jgi:hypothetical protein
MDSNNQQPVSSQPSGNMYNSPNTSGGTTTPTLNKKIGPIVATLVVIILVVIAALYLFGSYMNKQPASTSLNANNIDAAIADETVPTVTNTADDPQSLQNDLDTATAGVDTQTF